MVRGWDVFLWGGGEIYILGEGGESVQPKTSWFCYLKPGGTGWLGPFLTTSAAVLNQRLELSQVLAGLVGYGMYHLVCYTASHGGTL